MKDLLQQGIVAFRAGKHGEARKFFAAAAKQNENDERIWGWMYNVCNNDKERIYCLRQILRINHNNKKASLLLAELTSTEFPLEKPLTSKSQHPPEQKTPSISTTQVKRTTTSKKLLSKESAIVGGMVIVTLMFMCLCLYLFYSSRDGGSESGSRSGSGNKDADHSNMASVICQKIVKNSLIAPSTAKFPWPSGNEVRRLGNNVYEVSSYVDAQNSFGAIIRNNYYCKLQYTGEDTSSAKANINNWELLDFNISP